jgi:Zn-dependent protease
LRFKGVWRIAKVAGVDVNIHWSFSLVILWMVWQSLFGYRQLPGVIFISVTLLLLFGCVALHELGHALVARRLDVTVKNIIILPIGGLAQVQSLPDKPLYDLLIAAAGPLVNLALAMGAVSSLVIMGKFNFLLGFFASPDTVTEAILESPFHQDAFAGLVIFMLIVNGLLFAFNLIPAFPMDGGRVLRALLGMFLPYGRATWIALVMGQFLAILLLLAAFRLRSFALLLVGGFVLAAGLFAKFGR